MSTQSTPSPSDSDVDWAAYKKIYRSWKNREARRDAARFYVQWARQRKKPIPPHIQHVADQPDEPMPTVDDIPSQ